MYIWLCSKHTQELIILLGIENPRVSSFKVFSVNLKVDHILFNKVECIGMLFTKKYL